MTIIVLNDMNIIIHKKFDISVNYHNLCYFHRTAFYRFDMILSFSGEKKLLTTLGCLWSTRVTSNIFHGKGLAHVQLIYEQNAEKLSLHLH